MSSSSPVASILIQHYMGLPDPEKKLYLEEIRDLCDTLEESSDNVSENIKSYNPKGNTND